MTQGDTVQQPSGGWRNRDHTRGRLIVSLLVLSLPLITTSLSGVIFQVVDLGMISRLGEDAVTAIIVSNQSLRQIILVLAMGASFGAQALVSQYVGGGRIDAAEHVTGQVVLFVRSIFWSRQQNPRDSGDSV